MSKIFDISRILNPQIENWPGDIGFELNQTLSQKEGYSVNLSRITMSIHTGSHVDAPYHFDSKGDSAEMLSLQPFWGPAQVVSVRKELGELLPEDLAGVDLSLAPRLLLHTRASQIYENIFSDKIVHPSPKLAVYLAQAGIILLGTDAPSMDAITDPILLGHNALYRHGISILEGLTLDGIPDGIYELVALPLKIEGGDGSPVRAALRSLDN
jgi:arylformamidase